MDTPGRFPSILLPRAFRSAASVTAVVLALACSSGPPADEPRRTTAPADGATVAPPPDEPVPLACPDDSSPSAVPRAELQAFLDRGFQDLLTRVRTAPVVDRQGAGARFVGYRLIALDPALRCGAFALREGDVLTAVNGRSVERPEEALEVWESLSEATTITLSLIRGGLAIEPALAIEDEDVRIDNEGVTVGTEP